MATMTETTSKTATGDKPQTANLPQNLFWNALGQCFDLMRYDPIQPEASQLKGASSRSVVRLDLETAPNNVSKLVSSRNGFPAGTESDGHYEIDSNVSETRCIYTRRDYQKTFTETSRTKVSGPLGRNSFSASESFSRTVRTSKAKTRMSVFNDRQVVRFGARLKTEGQPSAGGPVRLTLDLDPQFVAAVAGLPVSGAWEQRYAQFIDLWGTHFAEAIDVGGRAYLTSIFSEDQYESMVKENLKVSVGAKGTFRGVTGSGGGTYEQQTARRFQEITGINRKQVYAVGGTLQDNLDDWVKTIDDHPGVVNTRLRPLYELLHDGHFPKDGDIALKRTLLMMAVQGHLDETPAPIDRYPGLLIYKNSEFDVLQRVIYYSTQSGVSVTGLDPMDISSMIAARGLWALFVDNKYKGLIASPSDNYPQNHEIPASLYPHSNTWGHGHDYNDDLTGVQYLGPDPADEEPVVYVFVKDQLQGDHDSDKRPIRVSANLKNGLPWAPQSALAVNGEWMLYRNDDLVGKLLDPRAGDVEGQPGQYRTLEPTANPGQVRLELQVPTLPWQPRTAPSVKGTDMAHRISQKDYAKGRWDGKTWTHVRYAVSFVTADGESFVGPWSSWFGFAAAKLIMPRIYDLPIDETGPDPEHPVKAPISSRRIYRQFGADAKTGAPAKLDRPERVMEVDDATSTKTQGYDTKQ